MKIDVVRIMFVALAVISGGGCGTQNAMEQVKNDAGVAVNASSNMQNSNGSRVKDYSRKSIQQQDVNEPWLAGRSVPLSREVSLPAVLRTRLRLTGDGVNALGQTRITAISPECNPSTYTLQRLANCIMAVAGIPVRIRPEALLPAAQFAWRRNVSAAPGAAVGSAGGSATPMDLLAVSPIDMELNALLDMADATWGVSHRLTDSGAIEIYRLETRVLRIKALSQKTPTTVTSSAGFMGDSKTTYESTSTDVMATMKASMMLLGTQAGTVEINLDTKSVLVIDTPEAIARIESYLESENKRLTRRISLIFEELFVTSTQGNEMSIDWTQLYTKTSTSTAGTTTTVDGASTSTSTDTITSSVSTLIGSPASLVSSNVGKMGVELATSGTYAGSTGFIRALNEMGFSVTRRSFPISTLSGSSQTIGLPTIFDYVSSVTGATATSISTTNTVSSPTITQKEDKYGVFLTVTPEAHDDGQILISMNMADRSGTLSSYTVEVSGSGTTVQQRNIKETNLTARTVLRSGVTHLVGGLDEALSTSSSRRLDEKSSIALGGSDIASQSSRHIVLLVTAIAEESI